jgi:hypothetical protein
VTLTLKVLQEAQHPNQQEINFTDTIEGGFQVKTKQTRTEQIELIEGGPQLDFEEEHNLLVESSYFTEPQPDPLYTH